MKLKENVYEVIKNDGRFTILTEILENTGIGDKLCEEQKAFTFFAPTDEAFNKLSVKALNILTSPESKGLVAAIIDQHMIPRSYLYSNDLRHQDSVKTMNGNKLKIKEEGNVLQLEEAHILMPGIATSNAVLFPIDKVLPARRKAVLRHSNKKIN